MGLSLDMVGALSGTVWGWSSGGLEEAHIAELGLDPQDATIMQAMALTRELIGFPRHLSQHVGGFVITQGPLEEVVPVQNAAMADRTFVEWDKDDLDALGILKIDVLALGMLTCIAKSFELLAAHYDRPETLASVPPEDPRVYDMLCRADSIGVFQVESRAQMTMLPRLKPRKFYDLVIEVAIVRPGPIQGDMVHPYLRRREGREKVTFPSKDLEDVLGKTLGVPLFQEQAMRIAIVAAGFTPSEADRLRRAMATFRKAGIIHEFGVRLVDGMVKNGYDRDFAERCFKQIEGFGEYGFPESHAASFALLVYISAWIKWHYPDVFLAAILNSQPMGFYAPAQLVRDAREHGVTVRPVCINRSLWDSRLESSDGPEAPPLTEEGGNACAVRLGFRQIKGFKEDDGHRVMAAREKGPFRSVRDLWARTGLATLGLEKLADADAFAGLGLSRREALWEIRALGGDPLPLFAALDEGTEKPEVPVAEAAPRLPALTDGEAVVQDYRSLRLSLKDHPMRFLRPRLEARGFARAEELKTLPPDGRLRVAGLVLVRQRPGSASGVIFATLEDETGVANIVVWPDVFKAHRKIVMGARLMAVRGRLQREGLVIHVVAEKLWDMSHALGALSADHETMGDALSPADEVKRPAEDPRAKGEFQSMMKIRRSLRASASVRRVLPKSRDFH
jgi:error-prone DNA polymerase